MKKVLSLVLALALVLGSFAPVFAAENQYAAEGAKLVELGILTGDANGLRLDDELTRAELYTLVSRLMGQEETAKNYPIKGSVLKFTDLEGHWADNIAGWAFGQELTKGYSATEFAPEVKATVQMLQALMLRVLGYTDVEWDNVPATAVAKGIMGDIEAEGNSTRGLMSALVLNTLKTETATGTILAIDLGFDDLVVVVPPVVEEELTVDSITGTNFKELVIKFNKAVDEDTVTAANFVIDEENAASVSLADDNMTVTATITAGAISTVQPAAYTVEIADVTDTDGNAMEDYTEDVAVLDVEIPAVVGVELTGPKTFEITFSEPIKSDLSVKVNNGVYGSTVGTLGTDTVEVTLAATSLPEKDYSIKISGYKDFAGIKGATTTETLSYVEDTTAPTVSIKSATQQKVVVLFDRAVKLETGATEEYFYHTFSTWAPTTASATLVNGYAKEWTLQFNEYPIPEGSTSLAIRNESMTNEVAIVDQWGNELAGKVTLALSVTADVTAPTVTAITVKNEQEVRIYFSEDVVGADDADNFAILDVDGEAVEIDDLSYVSDAVEEEYYALLKWNADLTGGVYTFEITGIEDKALTINAMAKVTDEFEITDLTPIETVAGTVTANAIFDNADENDVLYIAFPEKMATEGDYSVLNPENYLIIDGTTSTTAALSDDATLELFGLEGKTVKITMPHIVGFVETDKLQMGRVADASGNKFTALAMDIEIELETGAAITAVKQTEANKLIVTFDKALTSILADAFVITEAGGSTTSTAASIEEWSVKDGKTTATVVIPADMVTSIAAATAYTTETSLLLTGNGTIDLVGEYVVSETGQQSTSVAGLIVLDYRAPVLLSTTTGAATTTNAIVLVFSETLDNTKAGLYGLDLVVKNSDGDVLTAGLDFETQLISINGTNDAIEITADLTHGLDADTYTVYSNASITYIRDNSAQNNNAEAFTTAVKVEVK